MKTEKKSGVREKILKAAVSLLGDCGLRKLAQPQIAKKAKIPQGHITYYFPTRSDLLLAVAERSLYSIADIVMKSAGKAAVETDFLPLILPLIKDEVRTRMLLGLLVESDENPELRKRLRKSLSFTYSLIATATGKEDDAEVRLVSASLLGLGIQHYLEGPESTESVRQALSVLSENLKRGKL